MAVFFLAEIQAITDEPLYREYVEKAGPVVKKFGGEFILRSERLFPVSGEWDVKRIIMIRFPDQERVRACFQSEEYQRIAPLRENSTVSKAVIIEE